MAKQLALSPVGHGKKGGDQVRKFLVSVRKAQEFKFIADPTPNLAGKVLWLPHKHVFKVLAQKVKKDVDDHFVVDSSVDADTYLQLKWLAYKNAIDAWNECDGSQRHRIKTPTQLIITPAARS